MTQKQKHKEGKLEGILKSAQKIPEHIRLAETELAITDAVASATKIYDKKKKQTRYETDIRKVDSKLADEVVERIVYDTVVVKDGLTEDDHKYLKQHFKHQIDYTFKARTGLTKSQLKDLILKNGLSGLPQKLNAELRKEDFKEAQEKFKSKIFPNKANRDATLKLRDEYVKELESQGFEDAKYLGVNEVEEVIYQNAFPKNGSRYNN